MNWNLHWKGRPTGLCCIQRRFRGGSRATQGKGIFVTTMGLLGSAPAVSWRMRLLGPGLGVRIQPALPRLIPPTTPRPKPPLGLPCPCPKHLLLASILPIPLSPIPCAGLSSLVQAPNLVFWSWHRPLRRPSRLLKWH